jgi:hypothetical protein
MEQKYNYQASKTPVGGYHDFEDNSSAGTLKTPYLNEAINFLEDFHDGVLIVIKNSSENTDDVAEQSLDLPYHEIKNLTQKEILEKIDNLFAERDGKSSHL